MDCGAPIPPNEHSGCAVQPNDHAEAYICFCPQFSKIQLIIPNDFLTSVNNYSPPAAIVNKSY